MTPEVAQKFKEVFDSHADAIRALRQAQEQMLAAARALSDAGQVQGDAMTAALAANRSAIDLLHLVHPDL